MQFYILCINCKYTFSKLQMFAKLDVRTIIIAWALGIYLKSDFQQQKSTLVKILLLVSNNSFFFLNDLLLKFNSFVR